MLLILDIYTIMCNSITQNDADREFTYTSLKIGFGCLLVDCPSDGIRESQDEVMCANNRKKPRTAAGLFFIQKTPLRVLFCFIIREDYWRWFVNATHWPWFLNDGLVNVCHPPFLHSSLCVGVVSPGGVTLSTVTFHAVVHALELFAASTARTCQ